jgi:uncharacterized protein YidB (DUF937 family)
MGILDSLQNSPAFKGMLGQIEAAAIPAILGEVLGASGGQGGLTAIVNKLQQGGLGEQVKSWIGTGQNIPISADQLQQALGSDVAKQLAARFNIPLDRLAQLVTMAVDHASPNGTLPHGA